VWDEPERKYTRAIERYAGKRPDDLDEPAMLAHMGRWRDG
jgi:hypothetical protein